MDCPYCKALNVAAREICDSCGHALPTSLALPTTAESDEAWLTRRVAKRAREQMVLGATVGAVGLLITLGSYGAAGASGGGRYLITWGPMLFGVGTFVRGLLGWEEARAPRRPRD